MTTVEQMPDPAVAPARHRADRAGGGSGATAVDGGRRHAGPALSVVEGNGGAHVAARPQHDAAEASAALRQRVLDGRPEATARQHSLGKLTARERLALLLDEGSFTEIELYRRHRAHGLGLERNRPHTDGVVAGSGTVDGRRVFVYAQDFTLFGGSLGETHAAKICKVLDLAVATGSPIIGLNDSGGARIQEGAMALAGYGEIFRRQVAASGVVPQISVVLGPCAGGAAYSPALTDFTFVVRGTGQMYLTGPDVVSAVTGEQVSREELGGADVHGRCSGVASFVHDDEADCFDAVRYLVSLLPANNLEFPPSGPGRDAAADALPELADLVPADPRQAYDMRDVVGELVDDGDYLEVHELWAPNVVCLLGRVDGQVAGVVANQPLTLAGVLDGPASEKAARFVRFCDAFNIPLVTLVDVPGFLPGTEQERSGIIRRGAKLLYAYCEATVPRVQVILRKAYGGAYIVMDSRSVGADLSLAWPTNEIAVMGAEAAVDVLHRRELAAADDPAERRVELAQRYAAELVHPHYAAERGLVDDVIDPSETRSAVARGLAMLTGKRSQPPRRKHGNISL